MGFNIKREGFVKATDLCVSLANDMASNGFNILYLNGAANTGPAVVASEGVTTIILEATSVVDPIVDAQPWRVVIEARSTHGFTQAEGQDPVPNFLYRNGHHNWIRLYICPPEQIIVDPFTGLWRVAFKHFQDTPVTTGTPGRTTTVDIRIQKAAGMLTLDSSLFEFDQTRRLPVPEGGYPDPSIRNGFFYCFNEDGSLDQDTVTLNIPNWNKSGDFQAHPLSYRLVLSDHGMAFALWGESYDSSAREFAWFCTQRMVDKDTGAIIVDGKAPLVTVFSLYGNGLNGNLNEADPLQIQYMITRESDINTPTFPRSAVIDEADSNRIINSVQQVAIGENKNFIVHFPNGLTTQRYGYPHELDMIAYTSADVVSQENHIEMTFFGEAQARKYAALASNNIYNKGMRILFQIEGTGVTVNR